MTVQSTPPKLDLSSFLELGAMPTLTEAGTGEFLVTAVAGTILMAGYGGDEVVTILIAQHLTNKKAPRADRVYKVETVLIRHNLGHPLDVQRWSSPTFAQAEIQVNNELHIWYSDRDPRHANAIDCNPLKR